MALSQESGTFLQGFSVFRRLLSQIFYYFPIAQRMKEGRLDGHYFVVNLFPIKYKCVGGIAGVARPHEFRILNRKGWARPAKRSRSKFLLFPDPDSYYAKGRYRRRTADGHCRVHNVEASRQPIGSNCQITFPALIIVTVAHQSSDR
jgi:hypothetical protein